MILKNSGIFNKKSIFNKLIIRVLLYLFLPFLLVTILLFNNIFSTMKKNYDNVKSLIVTQASQTRKEHIQNVQTITARITNNSNLSGFLYIDYSKNNLHYYTAQIVPILKLETTVLNNYSIFIFYTNESIPGGFNSFYNIKYLQAHDFLESPETERWITPSETEYHNNIFVPFKNHYTFMEKVYLNNELLYVLTVSVRENIMNSFLYSNIFEIPHSVSETKDMLLINYQEKFNEKTENYSKNPIIKLDTVGMNQSIGFIFEKDIQSNLIILIAILIIIFVIILGVIVVLFINKIFSSVYESIFEFENAIHTGFKNKIAITGNDEISQIRKVFNTQIDKIQALIKVTAQQKIIVHENKLKALQQQINPHFLYNTMEVFSYRLERYKLFQEADAMVAFSNMLRYNIAGDEKFASLKQEVEHLKNYLNVQALKYENIHFDVNISEDLYSFKIPRFLLQPIVENCFTHGYYGKPLQITLNVLNNKKDVIFEVCDSGKGIKKDLLERINEDLRHKQNKLILGIGLHNINSRLCMFYNDDSGLFVKSEEEKNTSVTWKIPKSLRKSSSPGEGESHE